METLHFTPTVPQVQMALWMAANGFAVGPNTPRPTSAKPAAYFEGVWPGQQADDEPSVFKDAVFTVFVHRTTFSVHERGITGLRDWMVNVVGGRDGSRDRAWFDLDPRGVEYSLPVLIAATDYAASHRLTLVHASV